MFLKFEQNNYQWPDLRFKLRSKCDITVLDKIPPASVNIRTISNGASLLRPG